MLVEFLEMVNDYSTMAATPQITSGYEGVAFSQEEVGPTMFVKK